MNEYQKILKEYPSVINKEQLRLLLHISKRKVTYMLQNGFIPYEDTGKKTRNYSILLKDVVFYLEEVGAHPEKYVFPSGAFTANPAHQYIKNGECSGDDKKKLPEEFKRWLAKKWRRLPEKLAASRIAQETGYAKKTVDRWFREGRLRQCNCRERGYHARSG